MGLNEGEEKEIRLRSQEHSHMFMDSLMLKGFLLKKAA